MRDKDNKLYHKQIGLNVLLAVMSGVALFLAFPKFGFYPLAWFALVPLFVAIRRSNPWASFLLGLISGFVFFAGLLHWVTLFGSVPWLLLSLVEAIFIAIFAMLANLACRSKLLPVIAVPALWTAMEWTRTLGALAFPWGQLATSQVKFLPIIQLASLTGPWGITFIVAFANSAIADVMDRKARKSWLAVALACVIVAFVTGSASIHHFEKTQKTDQKVALVQGNIPMTWPDPAITSQIYRTYWPMTESIGSSDFIVWPESALEGDLYSSDVMQAEIAPLAVKNHSYLLLGGARGRANLIQKHGGDYNTCFLVSPTGKVAGYYDKVHLVPFGEFVPGRNWIPFIDKYPILKNDRCAGQSYHTLHTNRGDVGVMICFESTFPQIARQLTKHGAAILFIITNDSWFKDTPAAAQHFDCSILRAVENRRYVARNATTGISGVIDPSGRVIVSAGLNKKAVVRANVAMEQRKTIYTRWGDWFAYLCAAFGLFAVAFGWILPYNMKGHSR